MDAFENYFAGLRNKSIAVLGLGVSNRPLVRLLLEFGCQVTGCDKTPREELDEEVLELEKLGCKLHVGPDYLEGVQAEILFRTPGMHPNNPAIEALRQRGAQVTSEMEVFFEVCPCNLIAVTGSDGKTTTTTLVSEMLKASGKTVWLGLNAFSEKIQLAAVHDGARPLISWELIDRTVRAANSYGAAAPAIPVKDTIKVERSGLVESTPDRSRLRAVQTPQVFDFDLLRGALQKAREDGAEVTDDCSAVERLGMKIRLVEGEERNLKVTTPLDLKIAELLLEEKP